MMNKDKLTAYLKYYWSLNSYRFYEVLIFSSITVIATLYFGFKSEAGSLIYAIGLIAVFVSSKPRSPLNKVLDFVLLTPIKFHEVIYLTFINYFFRTFFLTILILINPILLLDSLEVTTDYSTIRLVLITISHYIIVFPFYHAAQTPKAVELDLRPKETLIKQILKLIFRIIIYVPGLLLWLFAIVLISFLSEFKYSDNFTFIFLVVLLPYIWIAVVYNMLKPFKKYINEHRRSRHKALTIKAELKMGLAGFISGILIMLPVSHYLGREISRRIDYKPKQFLEPYQVLYTSLVETNDLKSSIKGNDVKTALKIISNIDRNKFRYKLNFNKSNPLVYATIKEHKEVFEAIYNTNQFLKHKSYFDKRFCKEEEKCLKYDLISIAARRDYLDKVIFLEKKGHSLSSKEKIREMTPLMYASKSCSEKVAKYLIEKVPLNTQNALGNTALHLATKSKCRYITYLLLAKGANQDIKNQKGKLPKDLSKKGSFLFKILN